LIIDNSIGGDAFSDSGMLLLLLFLLIILRSCCCFAACCRAAAAAAADVGGIVLALRSVQWNASGSHLERSATQLH
jgi:hypothetical protein